MGEFIVDYYIGDWVHYNPKLEQSSATVCKIIDISYTSYNGYVYHLVELKTKNRYYTDSKYMVKIENPKKVALLITLYGD